MPSKYESDFKSIDKNNHPLIYRNLEIVMLDTSFQTLNNNHQITVIHH